MSRLGVASFLAAVVAASGALLPATAGEVPDPVLVTPGAPQTGNVALVPELQVVADGAAEWRLENGGSNELTFELAIHEVAGEPADGTPTLGAERTDVALRQRAVTLAAGETARVRIGIGRHAAALVVRTVGSDDSVELSAVATPSGAEMAPSVTLDGEVVRVRLDSEQAGVVDVRIRARLWPGATVADTVLTDVLVPPGGRTLRQSVPAIGHVTVDVVAGRGDEVARASRSGWWFPPTVVRGVATVAVLGALAVVGARWWRRRPAG